jgi:preprotein translocase subunit SecF
MQILKYKNILFIVSGIALAVSVYFMATGGLKFGVDFTGGSVLEFSYSGNVPDKADIEQTLTGFDLGSPVLRNSGNNDFILKTKTIDEATKNQVQQALTFDSKYQVNINRFNTIGPTLGSELKSKALVALLIVILTITLFIAYAFRKVSTPVSSWKYGYATMIALVHDIVITIGVFAVLGNFGYEIDSLFITAILVILGYSINDTIVVFDRVRDNLNQIDENKREKEFDNVLNVSFNQTIVRSFNTSLTTLISLSVLYLMNIAVIKGFVLALIVGVISGTYSSIFLAVPILSLFKRK